MTELVESGGEPEPSGRERLSALWMLYATSFRISPFRAGMSVVAATFTGVLFALTSGVIRDLTNDLAEGHRGRILGHAVQLMVLFGLITLGSVGLSLARVRLAEETAQHIEAKLARLMLELPTLDAFEKPAALDRLQLMRQNRWTFSVYVQISAWIISIVSVLVTSSVLLLSVSPLLLLIPAAAVPTLFIQPLSARKMTRYFNEIIGDARVRNASFDLATSPAAACEVRTYGLGAKLCDDYISMEKSLFDSWATKNRQSQLLISSGQILPGVVFALAMLLVLHRIRTGSATVGDVTLLGTVAATVQQMMSQVGQVFGVGAQTSASVTRLAWLQSYSRRRLRAMGTAPAPERLTTGISLRDVGFVYPSGDPALTGVSVEIPAGSTVALVGRNGAGKSTLVKLLLGLYEPTSGEILIDGTDLTTIAPEAWRTACAGSFQDHTRMHLTAGNAIGVGDLSRLEDLEHIAVAAERGAADAVIAGLDNGLDTQLGKDFEGVELSGGQWQKLSIARGMMRDEPLLLVLDEPTSALDPMTESQLFRNYVARAHETRQLTGGITLLVSHRFSTVREADLVIVIENGTVTELGTHEQLMGAGGEYSELYTAQASAYL